MSKTDKTRPYRVKRLDKGYIEIHDHSKGDCDIEEDRKIRQPNARSHWRTNQRCYIDFNYRYSDKVFGRPPSWRANNKIYWGIVRSQERVKLRQARFDPDVIVPDTLPRHSTVWDMW